jgi:hypothetical protein
MGAFYYNMLSEKYQLFIKLNAITAEGRWVEVNNERPKVHVYMCCLS